MPRALIRVPESLIVTALAFAAASSTVGDSRLDTVRMLLDEYYQETVQSVDARGRPSALGTLRNMNPIPELLTLYTQRDKGVLRLRGELWSTVCGAVGPSVFVDPLLSGLRDDDPMWRSFSADALGALRVNQAIPDLLAMLEDDEVVPNVVGRPTVAVFVAKALANLGRDDGVPVLLAHAATNEHWPAMFLNELRATSGRDFGNDLGKWQEWFRSR